MPSDYVFPPPYDLREKYKAVVLPKPDDAPKNEWPRCRVSVQRDGEELFQYDRNYAMMRTFEPFRQLRDGVWTEYALISKRYTGFEVVFLETGEVAAVERPDQKALDHAQVVKDRYTTGKHKDATDRTAEWYRTASLEDVASSWGFCPVEFWVPDVYDGYHRHEKDRAYIAKMHETQQAPEYWERKELLTGEFGVYCGCVWGDDTSWKIRYIDLSTISEGYVTADDRFGYVEMASTTTLHEHASFTSENGSFEFPVGLRFNAKTGLGSGWARDGIKWSSPERDDD